MHGFEAARCLLCGGLSTVTWFASPALSEYEMNMSYSRYEETFMRTTGPCGDRVFEA